MHELFNAGTSFGNCKFFEEAPEYALKMNATSPADEIFSMMTRRLRARGYQKGPLLISDFVMMPMKGFGDNPAPQRDDGYPG